MEASQTQFFFTMKMNIESSLAAGLVVVVAFTSVLAAGAQVRRDTGFTTRISSPNCVVHVRAKWGNNEGCVGTGIVIEEGGRKSVLTAAHVINRGAVVEIVFGGRDGHEEMRDERPFHQFGIQYAQSGRDAAKLTKVRIPGWIVPARISPSPPKTGALLTAYGLYDPDALRVRQARVVEGPRGPNESDRVYIGVTSEPGDSGSPVFNEEGEVVAILEGWENWWDQKTQTRVQSGPWGSLLEVRQWNEERKASRGPRLFDAKFRSY
jgi:hypothetical protein